MILEFFRHILAEGDAVDGQGPASRDAVRIGGIHDERAETAHFFLQEADGVFNIRCPQGIAADEFCEIFRVMSRRRFDRPHFYEFYRDAAADELPGSFRSGQAAPMIKTLFFMHYLTFFMVFTLCIAAENLIGSFFIMFDNHDAATKGTLLVDRLIPEDEVTFRILAAAVKDAAPLGLALDERPLAALGTGNPQSSTMALVLRHSGNPGHARKRP